MSELDHFAIMTYARRYFTNAALIHITTNNPCHLSLYYTSQKPLTHKVTRIIRGVGYPWGAYFCFVGWQIIPQLEAGDTYHHTFVLPGLSLNSRRFWTFRGTVAGNLSPSSGPIFEHYHPHQNIIVNSTFELWADSPQPPDHWLYSSTPMEPPAFYPSFDKPFPYWITCMARVPTWYSFMRLLQYPDPTHLSGLPMTFQVHYKGLGHWWDFMRVIAIGDDTRLVMARPTLPDTWHTLTLHITMPTNLSSLQLQLQNTGQDIPPPKDVLWWYPDIYYGYLS